MNVHYQEAPNQLGDKSSSLSSVIVLKVFVICGLFPISDDETTNYMDNCLPKTKTADTT